ncbi:hypothetical protein BJ508DRAFT_331191 [Ascobolus immersus RN42]|uniref:Zn(2)-C6 fungal-type domain-containing protein n=1 Tax=Ascobolus immersus RN42 TaxID=1160509 RepID=A0A3N4HR68_ASCIM|nr:hypothetical protein BJ508DRAFT_331191 [Ascobolus immersus RN42]
MNVSQLLTSDTPSREQHDYDTQQNMSSEQHYDEAAAAAQQEQHRQYEAQAPYTPLSTTGPYSQYPRQYYQQGPYQPSMRASPERYYEDVDRSHGRNRTEKMLETPGPYYNAQDRQYMQGREQYLEERGSRHGPLASADISQENILEGSRRKVNGFTSDNLPLQSDRYYAYEDQYQQYQPYLTPTSNSPSVPRDMRGSGGSVDHGYSRAYGWVTPAPSEEEDAARSLMMLGNQSRAASLSSPEQIHKANLVYSSEIEEEPCDSDSTELPDQQKQHQLQREEFYRQQQHYQQQELVRQQQAHYHQQQAAPQHHHHHHVPQHHHHHQQPQPTHHQHYPVQQHQSQSHGPLSSPITYTKKAKKMPSSSNGRFEEHAYASDYDRLDNGYRSETVKGEKDADYVDDVPYETPRSLITAPKRKPSQANKKKTTQKPAQRKSSSSSNKGGMAPPKLHPHLPSANLEAEFDAPLGKHRKTNNSAITAISSPVISSMPPPQLANLAPKSSTTSNAAAGPQIDTQKPRCQRCRKSKKGCDRQRPCARCRDAGIPADQCISEDESTIRRGRQSGAAKKKTAPVKLAVAPAALEEVIGGQPVGLPAGPLVHPDMMSGPPQQQMMMQTMEHGQMKASKGKRKRPVA